MAELKLFRYSYFPYELDLASREVSSLAGVAAERGTSDAFHVRRDLPPSVADRLTYFREIVNDHGGAVVPIQARLEAGARGNNEGAKQSTRYSAHGIHEYKGKFNPQMARSACNLLGLTCGDLVWDPFCGSGTVLLESLHQGLSAVGNDLNPLGVLIANAKITSLRSRPETLRAAAAAFVGALQAGEQSGSRSELYHQVLPHREYLTQWFPPAALTQFAFVFHAIQERVPRSLRSLFRVLVSNVVRECSWQDPADLRIRRRKNPDTDYPVLEMVCRHVEEQVRRILLARDVLSRPKGTQKAVLADSTSLPDIESRAGLSLRGTVAAIISSPPYATALPYIDTQRLNLALLGLASPSEIRGLDGDLLGSREIATRARRGLEDALRKNEAQLPPRTIKIVCDLLASLDPKKDGFRRANTPALIYRYFRGMARAFSHMHIALRRGGSAMLLVGPNRTNLGGQDWSIPTPELLAEIGESVGFDVKEIIPLQAYQRFSLHRKNAINEEQLVWLRKA